MVQLSVLAVIFALLGPLFYRIFTCYYIFLPPSLPNSYFSLNGKQGSCHKILDPEGRLRYCEDLTLWEDSAGENIGLLLSCDPGRKSWNTVMGPLKDPQPRGDIWFFDPLSAALEHLPLQGYPDSHDFHPLGISVVSSHPSKSSSFFAVNHGRANSTIEVFTLHPPSKQSPPALTYQRTLSHAALVAPNAIHPVSPTSLLVTQDHAFTRRLPYPLGHFVPIAETLLGLPLGRVEYMDFHGDDIAVTTAISRVPFANGIAVSPAGDELAVASTSTAMVNFYRISGTLSPEDFPLQPADAVRLPFAPDNLFWSASGHLYVAGHANFPALAKVAANKTLHAPSWVVSLTSPDGQADDLAPYLHTRRVRASQSRAMRTVYQSNGASGGFGGSTTAVADEKEGDLWVVGLYETGLLHCQT